MFALQLLHQVEHLGLDRDVQRRHRLVGDDEAWIQRERSREADALALAAGELVGVAVSRDGLESHREEQFADARSALRLGAVALDEEGLTENLGDLHARVQ